MNKKVQYKKTGFDKIDAIDFGVNLKRILPPNYQDIIVERIYHGNVNRNFKVISGHGSFFCKVAPLWYEGSLFREAWALKKLKQIGCNVPRVIGSFDKNNNAFAGHEIILLEYIEGKLVSDKKNVKDYYSQIIDLYNLVHSIKMKKYGWLDKNFVGENETWFDFLMQIENEKSINSLGNDWKKNLSFVRVELENIDCINSIKRLLYGDFNYSNFIVNSENKIVALDFQNCFSGDPLYDVGMIFSKDNNFENRLSDFKIFNKPYTENDKKLIFLYSLRHLLSMLVFYIASNNEERILFAKKRFIEIKNLYEKFC